MAEPFILIGLIAVVRRILTVTAEIERSLGIAKFEDQALELRGPHGAHSHSRRRPLLLPARWARAELRCGMLKAAMWLEVKPLIADEGQSDPSAIGKV